MEATQGEKLHDHHVVAFYDTEAFLLETVGDFLAPALRNGDAAIVVATPAHRVGFDAALERAGIDVDAALREGRYVALDAAELLSRFMVDGEPDAARFRETLGEVMKGASQNGRTIRAYGEMVALLWDEGAVTHALALEDMWNDFASDRSFELLCAYPMHAFSDASAGAPFARICEQHTRVIPSEGYSLLDEDQRSRAVAVLQQQAAALQPEVLDQRARLELLEEMVYVDALTGLANRYAFDEHLAREWALTRRHRTDSFVLVADLDALKHVNDRRGHTAGDQALREFGCALVAAARSTDIVARVGGDEFAILLIRCEEPAVRDFQTRLYAELAERSRPLQADLGATVGYASLLTAPSPATAFDRADLAMLARKPSRRV